VTLPESGAAGQFLGRFLRGAFAFGVGLALLCTLVAWSGPARVWEVLGAADPRLLGIAAAILLAQPFTVGVRWWLALRLCGYEGRFVSLLRATVVSQVTNFVAPGHFGEPVAATWLGRTGRAPGVEAFGLLVATKAVASLLNIVLLLACLGPLATPVRGSALPQASLIAGLALLLTVAAFTAILHPGIAAWGTVVLGRGTRTVAALTDRRGQDGDPRSVRLARWVEAFCGRFRGSFVLLARRPGALTATTALSVLKIGSLVVVVWLIYAALGAPIGPAAATFIAAADAAGNMAAVWVPGNMGVQEVVHTSAAAGALGIEQSVAVSAALVVKGLVVGQALFGGLLWLLLLPFDR
jgi:glycosyltransferase AglD